MEPAIGPAVALLQRTMTPRAGLRHKQTGVQPIAALQAQAARLSYKREAQEPQPGQHAQSTADGDCADDGAHDHLGGGASGVETVRSTVP
jgi:hypothetical protein